MTPLREVVREVEAAFNLKENLCPLDFITEVALRACSLAPAEGSQAMFVANPFTTVPLSFGGVMLEVAPDLSGCLSVVESVVVLFYLVYIFHFCFH